MGRVIFSVEGFGLGVARGLLGLRGRFETASVLSLFEQLGGVFPEELATAVASELDAVRGALDVLEGSTTSVEGAAAGDSPELPVLTATMLVHLGSAVGTLGDLAAAVSSASVAGVPASRLSEFGGSLGRRLLEYGVVTRLEATLFDVLKVAALLDIFRFTFDEPPEPNDDPTKTAFVARELRLNQLGRLLSDPRGLLRDSYGFGLASFGDLEVEDPKLNGSLLLQAIGDYLAAYGVRPQLDFGYDGFALESGLFRVSTNREAATPTLQFVLNVELPDGAAVTQVFAGDWIGGLHVTGDWPFGLKITWSPDGGLSAEADTAFSGGGVTLSASRAPSAGISLVGSGGSSRIAASELAIEAGVEFAGTGGLVSTGNAFVRVSLKGVSAVVDLAGGDGFTKSMGSGGRLEASCDVSATYSLRNGLQFEAGTGLELSVPLHVSFGAVQINGLNVSLPLQAGDSAIPLRFTTRATTAFGPFTMVVDRLGLELRPTFPSSGGNLGILDLPFPTFVAPTGIGVSIDSGGISGGGFLSRDPATGRYAGAIELRVYSLGIKAFGVLDTRFPDGTEGVSFVVVIIAEFTPIQLGFGFTLVGVGGLLGVNRTVDERALGEAVRTGSLAHLLFPVNVVQNAPAIINDLAAVFPATRDHHLFGPMAKLGWGTPTLITADIGVIIEFPGPRLALLGVVRMLLPSADFAILRLNAAIAGVLDFPAGRFEISASLFDSFVAGYVVSGDMAFRMQLGDRPQFLLSIGGFNSGFHAPAGFPSLRRASADLGVNGNPSLTATGYFALTSNSAQFGASIQLRASGYGIRLTGGYGFDVLFVFSPFRFTASVHAGVRVSFHGFGLGVTLHGSMSGPTPWRFNGRVCVEVAFWDACLPIDVTFGREQPSALPEMDPWLGNEDPTVDPRIQVIGLGSAVSDARNWEGEQPPDGYSVVSLAQAATAGRTPVDPVGPAVLRQKVCPLNQELEKFGEYVPIINTRFDVSSVSLGGVGVEFEPVEDEFARGQFENLSNAEKLSSDSYDQMVAGVRLAPNRVTAGTAGTQTPEYETVFVTAEGDRVEEETGDPRFVLTRDQLLGMLRRSAAGRGGVRRSGVQKYMLTGRPKLLTLDTPTFIVVDACTHVWNTAITGVEVSQTVARLKLRAYEKENPSDRGRFTVVPFYAKAA